MKRDNTYRKLSDEGMTDWILTGPMNLDLTKREEAIDLISAYMTLVGEVDNVSPEDYVDGFFEYWSETPDDVIYEGCKSIVIFEQNVEAVLDFDRSGLLELLGCRLRS